MKRDTRGQAQRIGMKPKTLDNWRSKGGGPPYLKLGSRVIYDDDEVDAWLAARRRTSTSDPGPAEQSAA
jgi:predicted DNA-binding transcriptional regulator AlpA